jgi:hypothetical protein
MFNFITNGMGFNPNLEFIIFTNRKEVFGSSVNKNIKIIEYDKQKLIIKINKMFELDIPFPISSVEFGRNFICGLKPFIPIIFDDYFRDCKYYGWMDHEIIIESGFDISLDNFLDSNNNTFSIGITSSSAQFQIFPNSENFKKFLYNNRYIYHNWRFCNNGQNGKIRFFEEIDVSNQDYLIGFIAMRNIFKKEKKSLIVNSIPGTIAIGSGFLRPKYPFSIRYSNGRFDKGSIQMLDSGNDASEFKSILSNSNIVWSLDKFFKIESFDFNLDEQIFEFDS